MKTQNIYQLLFRIHTNTSLIWHWFDPLHKNYFESKFIKFKAGSLVNLFISLFQNGAEHQQLKKKLNQKNTSNKYMSGLGQSTVFPSIFSLSSSLLCSVFVLFCPPCLWFPGLGWTPSLSCTFAGHLPDFHYSHQLLQYNAWLHFPLSTSSLFYAWGNTLGLFSQFVLWMLECSRGSSRAWCGELGHFHCIYLALHFYK